MRLFFKEIKLNSTFLIYHALMLKKKYNLNHVYALFCYKQYFFTTQPQCCLIFLWVELQVLFRCCLIHINTIMQKHFLCLLYLCPCLNLGLYMSHLCDLLFIFISIFIIINRIISWAETHLFFGLCFRIYPVIFGW